jgi:uncharacterized delta-60 repeat protein
MRSTILIGLCLFMLSSVSIARAAGTMDSSFGLGGKVTTNINAIPTSARLQPDGKIDVVESSGVARFFPNGAIDASFGRGGIANVGFSPVAMAFQSDGKLVVVGSVLDSFGSPAQAAVARLNQNGQLDQGFGNRGIVVMNFASGGVSIGSIVTLQSDGKVLAAGLARTGVCRRIVYTGLARLTSNGSFDATFGYGGMFSQRGIFRSAINSIALQSSGKVLVLGDSTSVIRLLSNGILDSSVTGGTIASIVHIGPSSFQLDGKIVTAGTIYEDYGYDYDVQAQRFMVTGTADSSFRSPTIDFGTTAPPNQFVVDTANALAIESGGRIVVGGISQAPDGSSKFGLARFSSSGALDPTFGSGGKLTTPFLTHAQLMAFAIQPDGKIIAVGFASGSAQNAPNQLVLARYMGP